MAACEATCNPELTFEEGTAIVTTNCKKITVDAKQYYTTPGDTAIQGVADIKVTRIGKGNSGD